MTVLEARDRVGGRSYTARKGTQLTELGGEPQTCNFDEGYYINPGPWRIPYHHRAYLHYAKKFNVPLELFNNDNDHSYSYFDKGSGPLNGKAIRKQEIAADTRGYATEMLAKQVNQGALDAEFSPGDKELFLAYLRSEGYLTGKDFKYIGTEGRGFEVDPGAGLNPGVKSKPLRPDRHPPFQHLGDAEVGLRLRPAADHVPACGRHGPDAGRVRAELKPHIIRKGHVVEKIAQDADKVVVSYVDDKGQRGSVTADYCICTIPLSVLRGIDLQVTPAFKKAISGVSYARWARSASR